MGALPLRAGYRAEPRSRRTQTGALSPCDVILSTPDRTDWREKLWQHLSLFSLFGQVGFSHWVDQSFNWLTHNSLTPAAQVHVRQCQKDSQTAGHRWTTSRRPLAQGGLFLQDTQWRIHCTLLTKQCPFPLDWPRDCHLKKKENIK